MERPQKCVLWVRGRAKENDLNVGYCVEMHSEIKLKLDRAIDFEHEMHRIAIGRAAYICEFSFGYCA